MHKAIATLLLAALACAASADLPPPATAIPTVTRLQDGLIALMQSDDPAPARAEALTRLLRETHDLGYIARIVLGRHWRALSPAEQSAFVERFETLSVASYAGRFKRYSRERFAPPQEHPIAEGEQSVRSVLTAANGTTHELEYLLRRDGEQWRIVNIIVEGVSDLALKRAEYGRLMQEGGYSVLLAELERQIERLRGEAAEPT